jgi:hypothetical protein
MEDHEQALDTQAKTDEHGKYMGITLCTDDPQERIIAQVLAGLNDFQEESEEFNDTSDAANKIIRGVKSSFAKILRRLALLGEGRESALVQDVAEKVGNFIKEYCAETELKRLNKEWKDRQTSHTRQESREEMVMDTQEENTLPAGNFNDIAAGIGAGSVKDSMHAPGRRQTTPEQWVRTPSPDPSLYMVESTPHKTVVPGTPGQDPFGAVPEHRKPMGPDMEPLYFNQLRRTKRGHTPCTATENNEFLVQTIENGEQTTVLKRLEDIINDIDARCVANGNAACDTVDAMLQFSTNLKHQVSHHEDRIRLLEQAMCGLVSGLQSTSSDTRPKPGRSVPCPNDRIST